MSRQLTFVLFGCLCFGSLSPVVSAQDAEEESAPTDLFQFQPETPEQLVRAVQICQRMNRPAAARYFMQRLVSPLPPADELVELRRDLGIGVILELYSDRNLQPMARDLLMAVNEASAQVAPSELRIRQLLEQPGTTRRERADAVLEILAAEDAAVPVLMAAAPDSEAGRLASAILLEHTRMLRHGLLQQMESVDDATRVRILRLLYRTGDVELVQHLLRWQFGSDVSESVSSQAAVTISALSGNRSVPGSPAEAAATLERRIRELLSGAADRLGQQDVPSQEARLVDAQQRQEMLTLAARLVNDLNHISGDADSAESLALVTRYAALSPGEAKDDGLQELSLLQNSLDVALQVGNHRAAQELLRRIGLVYQNDASSVPEASLLNDGLASSDVRVRAAAAAVMAATGQRSASPVLFRQQADALIEGSLAPEAVVIDPRAITRAELAAVLRDAGYITVAAVTGTEGFDAAVSQLQCELILIHANSQQWPLSLAVANFRADARTAEVPIVVYGPRRNRDAVMRLASNYDGVWFFEEPVTELTLFERLAYYNVPSPLLTTDERLELKSLAPLLAEQGIATAE